MQLMNEGWRIGIFRRGGGGGIDDSQFTLKVSHVGRRSDLFPGSNFAQAGRKLNLNHRCFEETEI